MGSKTFVYQLAAMALAGAALAACNKGGSSGPAPTPVPPPYQGYAYPSTTCSQMDPNWNTYQFNAGQTNYGNPYGAGLNQPLGVQPYSGQPTFGTDYGGRYNGGMTPYNGPVIDHSREEPHRLPRGDWNQPGNDDHRDEGRDDWHHDHDDDHRDDHWGDHRDDHRDDHHECHTDSYHDCDDDSRGPIATNPDSRGTPPPIVNQNPYPSSFCGCAPGFVPTCGPRGLLCLPLQGYQSVQQGWSVALWNYRESHYYSQQSAYTNGCYNSAAQICDQIGTTRGDGTQCVQMGSQSGRPVGVWTIRARY